MADDSGEISWFQPNPRAILPLNSFYVSLSLRKSAKKFEIRMNQNFEMTMRNCMRPKENWINEELIQVYCELFSQGKCRTVEAWFDGQMVGGVYGVSLGGAFMAESMFHRKTDAGKVALWKLVLKLIECNYELLDVQFMTPHLKSLGAVNVSHSKYMQMLTKALAANTNWNLDCG